MGFVWTLSPKVMKESKERLKYKYQINSAGLFWISV